MNIFKSMLSVYQQVRSGSGDWWKPDTTQMINNDSTTFIQLNDIRTIINNMENNKAISEDDINTIFLKLYVQQPANNIIKFNGLK